jgi:hypothetical protein
MTMTGTALELLGVTGGVPLKVDTAAAVHPMHYYFVVSEDGKHSEVFLVPCGCARVAELLRTYGLPRKSLVFDIGGIICIDDTLH